MISDTIRLSPRQERCLDGLEQAGKMIAGHEYLAEAMYPPPADEPREFRNLLTVTVCQLRRLLRNSSAAWEIETVHGRGYRLIPKPAHGQRGG